MKIFTTATLFTILAVFVLFTTGCPEHKSIAEIERNPGKYQDKEVIVTGRVVDSYGVSLPGFGGGGAYKIDDGTGSIWILSTDRSVPSKGAEVGVQGRIGSGINWKGRNYGLGMYEEKRRYGKR
ncbi:MAG: hypothetical protein ABJB40_06595 [Acidobacteriota bacterium]